MAEQSVILGPGAGDLSSNVPVAAELLGDTGLCYTHHEASTGSRKTALAVPDLISACPVYAGCADTGLGCPQSVFHSLLDWSYRFTLGGELLGADVISSSGIVLPLSCDGVIIKRKTPLSLEPLFRPT